MTSSAVPEVRIRPARREDALALAKLALLAGEGMPAFFWASSRQPGQSIEEAGAAKVRSETANFSYRNARVADVDGEVAGMLLAYRLPDADAAEDLASLPEFIRPLIELEQQAPGSYYINMLATFPRYRDRGIGSALMGIVDAEARRLGCTLTSIEVFSENKGAVRLYERLGYAIVDRRPVVPHECFPYATGDVLLLTRVV